MSKKRAKKPARPKAERQPDIWGGWMVVKDDFWVSVHGGPTGQKTAAFQAGLIEGRVVAVRLIEDVLRKGGAS